jgi:SAM-dependent methyltransferase
MGMKHPSLAYLFRYVFARQMLEGLPPGRFLEIGVGRGEFFKELAHRGFEGTCLDLNPLVIQHHLNKNAPEIRQIQFVCADFNSRRDRFDLLVAFEVLEHYLDDLECLQQWHSLLKDEGHLILSVPAHMNLWTGNDTRAGHARRYERKELEQKMVQCGFEVELLWSYGFPVLNWSYRFSSLFKREQPPLKLSEVRTTGAGLEPVSGSGRPMEEEKTRRSGNFQFGSLVDFFFQEAFWRPFWPSQRKALLKDNGVGYLLRCRKLR